MNTNIVKSLLMSVVLVVVSVFAVNAQTIAGTEKQNEIRYAGSNHDFINFEVNVRNSQKATLRIIDEDGVEIYRENITKGDFNKTVKIVRNDYSRLNFVIDSQNGQFRKTFNIKSELVERLNVEEAGK